MIVRNITYSQTTLVAYRSLYEPRATNIFIPNVIVLDYHTAETILADQMFHFWPWLCLIGITCIALLPVQATLPPKELEAVRDLFLATHGFPLTEDPCTFWNQIDCEKNHVTALRLLEHYPQKSLPESIGNLQLLSVLDVSYGKLESLPESIGKLQALSELHVSWNQLKSLPESIGKLQALAELHVSWNQLQSLPESIGKLQALAELDVSHNNLTPLPESIGNLQAMSRLHVGGNQLKSLPESIGNLQLLSGLHVSPNQLTSLPESIGKLQKLYSLDVSRNKLESLPQSIGKLQELDWLYASYNQLTSLPEKSIGELQELYSLDVSHNKLESLPQSIGKLQKLDRLDVSWNQLKSLPESIGKLQALSQLHVSSNQLQLAALPESIGNLQLLSVLDVSYNKLMSLPESIGKLQALSELHVSWNQLKSLPESIGNLQALAELHVSSNQLKSLPESIGSLRALTELHLPNNMLPSLPKSIGDMQGLLWLDVSHNQLNNTLPEALIGNLQKLKWLDVSYNNLTSLPHLKLGQLIDLRASGNRLTLLPESLGNLEQLGTLALSHNSLERLPKNLMRLSNLRSVFVDSNQLHDPIELCRFEHSMLRVLYAHNNRLKGEMPVCLTRYTSMQTLTLHSNLLNGNIPRALSRLPELKLLTLHENSLSGFLPDFAEATSLTLFSAYSNDLKGSIPPFSLSKDCVDDASFLDQDGNPCYLSKCSRIVATYCRRSCGLCDEAKARGPVLLLHNNRLSCDLPEQVTKWTNDIRSLSLVGNMLGNGSIGLPTWIHSDEQQKFLYLSSNKIMDMFLTTMLYLAFLRICSVIFTQIAMPDFGNILQAEAGTRLLHRSHLFVWRLCIALSLMATVLLILYLSYSTYYECTSGFSSTTLSNLFEPRDGGHIFVEWVIVLMWIMWVVVSAIFVEKAYPCSDREAEDTATSHMTDPETANWRGRCVQYVWKILCSFLWVCIVSFCRFPL